jgi:Flp pilus assembly protein TadG
MRSLSSWLRKFRSDVEAVAAIEFAIVLPFMLLLMIGGVELGNGMAISVKVTETTHTVADMVSQNKCLTSAQVTGFLNASARVISPYSVNYAVVTVSEVTTVGSGGTATVTWSQSLNGTARPTGQVVTLPSSLASAPGNIGLILGEVTYAYAPNLGYTITGTVTLSDSYYLYPRQTTFVQLKTSCP